MDGLGGGAVAVGDMDTEGVLVLDRHPAQIPSGRLGGAEGFVGGRLDAGAFDDRGEDVAGGAGHVRADGRAGRRSWTPHTAGCRAGRG